MVNIKDFDFAGKKAIVRVDFNVPLNEKGEITDDTRIRGALPTLKKILADGGALILMSHMGKPKGKVNPKLSLGQIAGAVAAALGVSSVKFAPDCCSRTCVSIPKRKASPWALTKKIPPLPRQRRR